MLKIQLTQLTTEPDYTPQTSTNREKNELPQESYHELMRDVPDKYPSDNIQSFPVHTDNSPEIHHMSTFSTNQQNNQF